MTSKLRLVVFTSGELTPVNRVFFERLARDPLFDLAAIIVDDYQRPKKSILSRAVLALRGDGPRWLVFKIESKLRSFAERAALRLADWIHRPRLEESDVTLLEESYVTLSARTGAAIHRVADIHSAGSIALIRSLAPELGVIVGTRILHDAVTAIPVYGTLNLHKRKLPDYRGGGPVGYWEILAGEKSIGVSIHYAATQVDAGAVLAEARIPIERCDTLESLKLKADLRGATLYHETLRHFAEGEREGVAQDLTTGRTYRAPSDFKVWQLQRRLERAAQATMGATGSSWISRLRVGAQFTTVLPRLMGLRRRLIRENRAPISIFFYHLVSDSPLNHMSLRLPVFVRQVEFLRRYYPIVSLDDAVERLRSGKNDRICAAITFDDGYRDNTWAIEYLRYFNIPATFFISIGHVLDGSSFQHDERFGYSNATPMSEADLRHLVSNGFMVGSHGVHHEDFGSLSPQTADRILRESRELIEKVCGSGVAHFAFPKGLRGKNITADTFELALKHFPYIYSAYGGYCFPQPERRHFLRMGNPTSVFDLGLLMSGYTGFRDCLRGNAWGRKTELLDPCTAPVKVTLIAASPEIVGGQSVQAQALASSLRNAGYDVSLLPIDMPFPRGLRWVRQVRYARTLLNQILYIPSLLGIRHADIVHVFSASYWSFLLAPVPAIVIAKLFRKPVVLHYHSGEADDHLRRWRRSVAPFLRLVDQIVVPSVYLESVFASHGFRACVIPNLIDSAQFRYRERAALRPMLLSTRNLENYYDVANTVTAFAQVKKHFPEAKLTIAGHGSHEPKLRKLTDELKLTDVQFVGRVDTAALPAMYDAADIFVNSSVLDNQPVSILEAFASGLPVVSTPTGDISSMLRGGEAGLLVETRDPSQMADAITRLLRDPDLSLKLARTARQEAERYAPPAVVKQWTQLYKTVSS